MINPVVGAPELLQLLKKVLMSHNSQENSRFSHAEATSLGNNGNNCATHTNKGVSEGPVFDRRARLKLRESLWRVSSIEDFTKCGRVPNSSFFPVRQYGDEFRLAGFCTCKSVWCCPVCAPAIRAARGVELAGAIGVHLETGAASFGSATVPHGISNSLTQSLSVVMKAWHAVNVHRDVKEFRADHGYRGFCRTCEITHGANGWHPHLQWVDFWRDALGDADAEYQKILTERWAAAVVNLGMKEPSPERGVKVLGIGADFESDYLFKLTPKVAGYELTSLTTKVAKGLGGKTPFDLLALAGHSSDPIWRGVWHEYENSTRGRRMLGWSKGLRKELKVAKGDPDPDRFGLDIAFIDSLTMMAIRASRGGMIGVHEAIEAGAALGGKIGVKQAVALLLDTRAGVIRVPQLVEVIEEVPADLQLQLWGA